MEPRPHRTDSRRSRRLADRGGASGRALPRPRQEAEAVKRWLIAAAVYLFSRRRPKVVPREERIVAAGAPSPRAELFVVLLLALAAVCAAGFIAAYALDSIPHPTQFLGLGIGL